MAQDHHEHGHSQALGHVHPPANSGKAFAIGVALNGATHRRLVMCTRQPTLGKRSRLALP